MIKQLFYEVFDESVLAWTTPKDINFSASDSCGAFSKEQESYLREGALQLYQNPVTVNQVHGNGVQCVDQEFLEKSSSVCADALVTSLTDIPIAVRTADCLPIFLYDSTYPCIGIVHAGWKGSHQQIVAHTLKFMEDKYKVNISNIDVFFGPCIGVCCYEVGEEFFEYFPQEIVVRDERIFLDLKAVNKRQLLEQGVGLKSIVDSGVCTCCDQGYHSYRREGKLAGRMLSGIMLQRNR